MEAGADVNKSNEDGTSPILAVTETGCESLLRGLIEKGADVNTCNECGEFPLIMAAERGHVGCVNILLESGADVNREDSSEVTPLIAAAGVGSVDTVLHLLNAGAQINRIDVNGYNALKSHLRRNSPPARRLCRLLHAAGEIYVKSFFSPTLPTCLQFRKQRLQLKHICRVAVRNHLLKLDPHTQLFGRVPLLGLPPSLTSYLMFNMTLGPPTGNDEDADDDVDDDDKDDPDDDVTASIPSLPPPPIVEQYTVPNIKFTAPAESKDNCKTQ